VRLRRVFSCQSSGSRRDLVCPGYAWAVAVLKTIKPFLRAGRTTPDIRFQSVMPLAARKHSALSRKRPRGTSKQWRATTDW
jgi:hypothetical protein